MMDFLVPPGKESRAAADPPRFSILIATYQAAGSIVDAVESALAQTVPPHEVIVVDDGSTDDTAALLEPYDDRVVLLRQENRGAPAASNLGVRRATGDFVSILDADDVYEPGRLAAMTELAVARPDLDILCTDAVVEVDGVPAGRFFENTAFETVDQRRAIFERCFIAWPAVRRARFLESGGFDESFPIAYDWDCWIRLLHAGCRAGAVNRPLLRYRITGLGSLSDDRLPNLRARVRVLEAAAALDWTEGEAAVLEHFLDRRRRRLLLAEAEQGLRHRDPAARRLALRVAAARRLPPLTRLQALAAAAAPAFAARLLERRERRTGHTWLKRRAPRARSGT